MSTNTNTDFHSIIPVPRETYLRQNEGRIRSEALNSKTDPAVRLHMAAIEMAEDLHDYHETVISYFEKQKTDHRIPPHRRYKNQAFQLKLHHLDQLAHLTL